MFEGQLGLHLTVRVHVPKQGMLGSAALLRTTAGAIWRGIVAKQLIRRLAWQLPASTGMVHDCCNAQPSSGSLRVLFVEVCACGLP